MKEKLKIKLDASALVQSACGLRLTYILIDGYRERLPYNDTLLGSAVHTFMARMAETNGDLKAALKDAQTLFRTPHEIRPGKKHMTENFLVKTCIDYWSWLQDNDDCQIILNTEKKPCVEMYFEDLIAYEDDDIEIRLVGTMDRIAKIKNGAYCIRDYKTHSLFTVAKYGIPEFFDKYLLSTQLHFYVHCVYMLAKQNPDSILGEITKHNQLGFVIDGVFLSTKETTVFQSSDIMIPKQETLREFGILLDGEIAKLVTICKMHLAGIKYPREGLINGACIDRWKCKFADVCAVGHDDVSRLHVLKNNFIIKAYDPKMHGRE